MDTFTRVSVEGTRDVELTRCLANWTRVGHKLKKTTSTTPSSRGPIPAQKLLANSIPGAVFSHLMLEMDFNSVHRFGWEKIH